MSVRQLSKLLKHLQHGQLQVQCPTGETVVFGQDASLQASLHIHDWQVLAATLKSGDIGFAESYMAGHWTSPDAVTLLRLFLRNREALERVIYGAWWGSLFYRFKHWLKRNHRAGSKKNIHAHYDIGNDFYKLWLDEGMSYSSALFQGLNQDDLLGLSDAQQLILGQDAKMRRALTMVQATAQSRIAEIGCGWGGMAAMAVQAFGASLDGITLSDEQLAYGHARLAVLPLQGKARLMKLDYRDLPEHCLRDHPGKDSAKDQRYDALISIEMFEAVGKPYWHSYFQVVHDCIKPGARACIQSIVIRDDLFATYEKSTDFIQQYVFPGGFLPSAAEFKKYAAAAGLHVLEEFAFGQDYAQTLRIWQRNFMAQEAAVRALGFDTRFIKLWEFYLVYCEAAFSEGSTNVVQFTLVRPA